MWHKGHFKCFNNKYSSNLIFLASQTQLLEKAIFKQFRPHEFSNYFVLFWTNDKNSNKLQCMLSRKCKRCLRYVDRIGPVVQLRLNKNIIP
jgi:hypothetical protein